MRFSLPFAITTLSVLPGFGLMVMPDCKPRSVSLSLLFSFVSTFVVFGALSNTFGLFLGFANCSFGCTASAGFWFWSGSS
jgi:hypothetical protein